MKSGKGLVLVLNGVTCMALDGKGLGADTQTRKTRKVVTEGTTSLMQAPPPRNSSIVLEDVPGGLYAAVVFAGSAGHRAVLGRKERLRGDVASDNLQAKENEWVLAIYNSNWTLPPWRRNEVLIPIKEDSFTLWNGKPAP
jgi:SOUL heme-binding protein